MIAKRLPVILIVISLLLGFSGVRPVRSVSASSVEFLNTPWPTLTPVPYTPGVPTGTLSFTCSSGDPAGWGTVTPDPEWLLLCSSCVPDDTPTSTVAPLPTHTPLSTSCPDCTPTSTPGATSTPGVTSTPAGTATLSANTLEFVSWVAGAGGLAPGHTCSNYYNGFRCSFSFPSPSVRRSQYNSVLTFDRNGYTGTVYIVFDSLASGNFWYPDQPKTSVDWGLSSGSYPSVGSGSWVHGSYTLGSAFSSDTFFWSKAETGESVYWSGEVYFMPQPVLNTPVPTVTSIPSTGSYCESVQSEPPPSPFGYGEGEVVHNECAVFPGIDFTTGLIIDLITWIPFLQSLEDIIPAFELQPLTVCVDFYNYTLVIFNQEITIWKTILALVVFLSALRMWVPFGGFGATLSKPDDNSSSDSSSSGPDNPNS